MPPKAPPRPRAKVPRDDASRFFCPYPGCARSFAELWRLKVHYRAPPDVRGSGKERGHGCELQFCPKCGKELKAGKHHVGCFAGRSAPRQAAKRYRMVRRGESEGCGWGNAGGWRAWRARRARRRGAAAARRGAAGGWGAGGRLARPGRRGTMSHGLSTAGGPGRARSGLGGTRPARAPSRRRFGRLAARPPAPAPRLPLRQLCAHPGRRPALDRARAAPTRRALAAGRAFRGRFTHAPHLLPPRPRAPPPARPTRAPPTAGCRRRRSRSAPTATTC